MIAITTIDNECDNGLINYLEPSCEYHNIDLNVLEIDRKMESLREKDLMVSYYLKNIPDDEIILFTDGYDTFFVANETEIIEKFKLCKTKLLFAAEVNCMPDQNLSKLYEKNDYKFKYLNAGAFIGEAGFIKFLYNRYPFNSMIFGKRFEWSNQYCWHQIYLKHNKEIRLDYTSEIFYTLATNYAHIGDLNLSLEEDLSKFLLKEKKRIRDEILFVGNRFKVLETDTVPCHIHFPGRISKLLMGDDIFENLYVWK